VASQASDATEKAADFWTQGVGKLAGRLPALLPQVDLVPAVERYFDFVQRAVIMNRSIAVEWAQAVGALSGAAGSGRRRPVRSCASVPSRPVRPCASGPSRSSGPPASRRRRPRRPRRSWPGGSQDRAPERQGAHEKARARYQGMTKAELSDLLARRDLPKTGNVDDLVERLVEADGK